ncbi:MAG: hypothetical protein GY950_16880 [bacterium]|nr:hypothetical protein [bacterium]
MNETIKTRILVGYNQFLCAESLASGSQFGLSLFEDLNKLIEAVVLYDKVVLLGDYSLPSGLLATPLKKAGILQTMPNAEMRNIITQTSTQSRFRAYMIDVFGKDVAYVENATPGKLLDLRISPNIYDQISYNNLFEQTINCCSTGGYERQRFTHWINENILCTRDKGGHFYYLARAVLYATIAEQCGMDYAPDVLRLPMAALTFSSQTRALPKALYDGLVDKIHSEVESLTLLGMPIAVFVPPLTAKLLSTVDSPKDYSNELLELREKFSGFRKAYSEFLAVLKDPSITLKEKIDSKKKMITRITGIIESGQSGHALNVKTIWDKLISSSLDEGGSSTKLSLSGMVSLLLEQLAKEKTKGHARALFDLWTDTLNLKNYGQLIEKAFKTKIDATEVERYKRYSQALRQLIKSAGSSANSLEPDSR